MSLLVRVGLIALLLSIAASCSHSPVRAGGGETELAATIKDACAIGGDLRQASGSVWMKAESKEATGQFPANVKVSAPPPKLVLEVTNLMGGTEALIQVDGSRYTVKPAKDKAKTEAGTGTWGGIPLRWATDLFLGKFPCADNLSGAKLARNDDGQIEVVTAADLSHPAERYVYAFRSWAGAPWPERLHWERLEPGGKAEISVDFKFDAPEDYTKSPRKWEAKSSRGEVKVRWKDRETSI